MNRRLLERITERAISETDLRSEIQKLEGFAVPPSFWVEIANDPSYSARHRAICICQLFDRHVKNPISLGDLAELLAGSAWIDSSTVTTVDHLKGELPVEWHLGETVLAVRLFPAELEHPPILYLRVSEKLHAEAFVQMMKTAQHSDTALRAQVLQAACVW